MRGKPRSQSANSGLLNQQQEPPTRIRPNTDSERIDALAEAINRVILYETSPRGEKFKIDFTSTVPKGKKKHGMNPAFLRSLADGLLKAAR